MLHSLVLAVAPLQARRFSVGAIRPVAVVNLMGDAAFRAALHTFMARWAGKRPLPWDMFNSFNNAGVGNHTWFFRNWFFGYDHMDLALDGVRREDGVHTVAVRNPGGMAIPFDLVLTFTDGATERVHRTPATWQADGRGTEVRVASGKTLRSVSVDTGIFLDANPDDYTRAADKAGGP